MKLTILTTPKSITVKDSDNNRLSLVKTENGLELHSQSEKPNKYMQKLAVRFKETVLNPKDNRDNYKVRFERLAKEITAIGKPTYMALSRTLDTVES